MRNKTDDLRLALAGRFTDHHGQMVALHLARIDYLDQTLAADKTRSSVGARFHRLHRRFSGKQHPASTPKPRPDG